MNFVRWRGPFRVEFRDDSVQGFMENNISNLVFKVFRVEFRDSVWGVGGL